MTGPVVFLTHAAPRVHRVAGELGGQARALPMFTLSSALDATAAAALASELAGCDLVVFVSPSAIELFCDHFDAQRWPAQAAIGVIGSGSRAALAASTLAGRAARIVGSRDGVADAQALLGVLAAEHAAGRPAYRRTLILCGEGGARDFETGMAGLSIQTTVRAIYRRDPADARVLVDAGLIDCWRQDRPALLVFTMAAALERLLALARAHAAGLSDWLVRQPALVIHPRIDARARDLGFDSVTLIEPGLDALRLAIQSR